MFKQRVLTALVLLPLVILSVLYASNLVFFMIIGLLLIGLSIECQNLIPIHQKSRKALFVGLVLCAWLAFHLFALPLSFVLSILLLSLLLWGVLLAFIWHFPASQKIWGNPGTVAALSVFIFITFAESLLQIFLMAEGRGLLFYLLFLVFAADTGAYLFGKRFGKRKLIPAVSPGKTIEGTIGGLSLSLLVALIGFYWFWPERPLQWFVIAILVCLASMVGDLYISMLKRRVQIKDTGNLLPGHGGLLDRLDSLMPAAVFFYAGLVFLWPGISPVLE